MNHNEKRRKKLKERADRKVQLEGRRELRMVDSQMAVIDAQCPDRRCDGCTVCCTIMGVRELRKPYYETCKHVCEGGCAIYKDRPRSCYGFICGWRGGHVDGLRPDKQGLMVDAVLMRGIPVYVVYEVWPGAGEESNNVIWITALARKNGDVLFGKHAEVGKLKWWLDGETIVEGTRYNIPLPAVQTMALSWEKNGRAA